MATIEESVYNPASKARETLFEMFEQRGWDIIGINDTMLIAQKNPGEKPPQHVCAFISSTLSKFNVDRFQYYVNTAKNMGVDHCIVVYTETATAPAKKIVEMMPDFTMELFSDVELQYNPTKHILTPEHSLYARSGTVKCSEFKAKYGQGLPGLLRIDPVAKFLGFKHGDIVRVKRPGGLVTYRLVK